MEKASEKIIKIQISIKEKFSFISTFVQNKKLVAEIEDKLKYDKTDKYPELLRNLESTYSAMELILFCISELDGTAERIVESPYTKTLHLTEIINDMDILANDLYKMAKANPELEGELEKQLRQAKSVEDSYETFGVEENVFGQLNPEFLLPTEEYLSKDELPKDAKIVEIKIDNTQNTVVLMRKILDSDYVKKTYPRMFDMGGVSPDMIDRFSMMKEYPTPTSETEIVPLDIKEVYQKMGDVYRKLIHYPENDYVRNYKWLPINASITNFENKRIIMSRQATPKSKLYVGIPEKAIGLVKDNFVRRKMDISDAVFNALYRSDMTDEEVIKLGLASYGLQNTLPKKRSQIEEAFHSFINKKNLSKLL